MIPGSANPLLLATAAGAGGYEISRSLRFNSSDSAYCSRVPSTAGNRKTWTWAGWVKRSALGSTYGFFGAGGGGSPTPRTSFYFAADDSLTIFSAAASTTLNIDTTAVFRDVSAWYHILVALDTTQATAANRLRVYVNGIEQTSFATATYPTQNSDEVFNGAIAHNLGATNGPGNYFSGYLADVHFIDGQALDPSSFVEVSATTGQLIPKAYTGTYGTNGFYLKFADNSNNTATTLGKDSSGNGNNWTPNNLSVASDIFFADSRGSSLDGFIPAGWTRSSDPSTTLVNNQTGVLVDFNGTGYFAIKPTSSTVTIKWIVYDGSVSFVPTVSLATSRWSGTVNPSSTTGVGSSASPRVGTYSVTPGTTYYVRTGLTGDGNPALVVYVTDAIIAAIASNPGNDSLVDTPTSYGTDTGAGGEVRGNYCTWNPLSAGSTTLSNGNLSSVTNNQAGACGTIQFPPSGKWFFDLTFSQAAGQINHIGIIKSNPTVAMLATTVNTDAVLYRGDGNIFRNTGGGYSVVQTVSSYTSGDVIGVAVNNDASTVQFYKNGSTVGTAINLTTATEYTPFVHHGGQSTTSGGDANFGQRQWAYAAPAGFKALCDTNLPAPVVAKPNSFFDVKLWTGTGSSQTISGYEFSPDLVWIKGRSNAGSNALLDAVRGASLVLRSDTTAAETNNTSVFTSFNSNGFTLGADTVNGWTNFSSWTYVGWAWDAGSTTVTNTQGSITSQVRANASAGFSIVTYTGNGTNNATVGHSLGVAPELVLFKRRSGTAQDWGVYHVSGGRKNLQLNTTGAYLGGGATYWDAIPTSTVIYPDNVYVADHYQNVTGETYVAYCWAPVVGYSSFGSYTGNGSTDGPFVFTGMRSRLVMIKCSSSDQAGNAAWRIFDTARSEYNVIGPSLYANESIAEVNSTWLDVTSNGFKIRTTSTGLNASSATYIYAAFAESPFQTARAR